MKNILLFFMVFVYTTFAQITESGTLTSRVTTFIDNIPATVYGNQYAAPSSSQQSSWSTMISQIISSNYSGAHTTAQTFGYRLVQFTDTLTSKVYYIADKHPDSSNHWGLYVFDQAATRQRLVIQCPHPLFDSFTGLQGLQVFTTSGARALMISGTHRCNSDLLSVCAGTTTVCSGADTNFAKSDQAHNTDGAFYLSTTAMSSSISNLMIVQPHGFSKGTGDPDIILSNGTRRTPASTDYALTLKSNLLVIDSTLTFKTAHIDTTWNKLTGTTNVQGRHINGSSNPCSSSASSSSGRFIHIEQAYTLRSSESARQKLADAVTATFPADPLPVELTSFTAQVSGSTIVLRWSTATETNNHGFLIEQKLPSQQEFIQAGFVAGKGTSAQPQNYEFRLPVTAEGIVQFRLKQIDNDGTFKYSNITEVISSRATDVYLYPVFPNPAKKEITIRYRLNKRELVKLVCYNVLGKEIAVITNDYKERGEQSVRISTQSFSAGVYFIRFTAGNNSLTEKVVVGE